MGGQLGTVPVTAPIAPTHAEDHYASHWAYYGKGGLRTCTTLADRNAIEELRREVGMLVYVAEFAKYYKLEDDLVTWVEFTTGGGGTAGRFVHEQREPVDHITIAHPLERVPIVQIFDGSSRIMRGQVIPSATEIDVSFGVTTTFTLIAI
jgi:hypothetical protein